MSLKEKLARYKQHLKTDSAKPAASHLPKQVVADEQMQRVASQLGATVSSFENEFILIKENNYDLEFQHGHYRLSEFKDVINQWQCVTHDHPLSTQGRRTTDLLFFDTETTGLGSGVGHMIFLLGCAKFHNDHLQVRQYFLPSPGNEVALYHHFLNDVENLKNLVTFNGKAFDWPKVKTRHTLIRNMVPRLPSFGHYDLLHASRRLWKGSLPSTNLGTIESELLGIKRHQDIPGHMAPFLYFQFQKRPDAALMDGIFKHNEEDVLTLVTLYIHLSQLLLEKRAISPKEKYEVARWYAYIKEEELSISLFEKLVREEKGISDLTLQAKAQLVYLYKKQKRYSSVLQTIEELETAYFYDPNLYIEAAKIHEHQIKDYEKAYYYTNKAYQFFEQKKLKGDDVRGYQEEIIKRLKRIKTKLLK